MKPVEKKDLNNKVIFLSAREKVFNTFKSRIFPIKNKIPTPEPAPFLVLSKSIWQLLKSI